MQNRCDVIAWCVKINISTKLLKIININVDTYENIKYIGEIGSDF